jgi:hypothetical protein
MTSPTHASTAFAATVLAACVASAASAHDRIGVELRPSSPSVTVGDVIGVQVLAVREPTDGSNFTGFGERFIVLDLFFAWNPQDLRLLGLSSDGAAPQLISSGFLSPTSDYTGTNEAIPPADGTGYYVALAIGWNPVPATYEGTLVTTLRFQVLREFASTEVTPLTFVPIPGSTSLAYTQVLDAGAPNYPSTGSLGSAVLTQGSGGSCPADLVQGPSSPGVDGADLGFLLSAWGAVDSPANLIRDASSPTVDGADLGFLLAAWGPCGN